MLILCRWVFPEAQMMPNPLRVLHRQRQIDRHSIMPGLMKEIDSLTSEQIMHKLQSAISEMQMAKTHDDWLPPKG